METLNDYVLILTEEERKYYYKKLTTTNGVQLPDPVNLEDHWSNDIKYLPDITTRDVDTYLIDTPSPYTKEAMKAYNHSKPTITLNVAMSMIAFITTLVTYLNSVT